MAEKVQNKRTSASEAKMEAYTVGGARPHSGLIHLSEYDVAWPGLFTREAARINRVLGETASRRKHLGERCVENVGGTGRPTHRQHAFHSAEIPKVLEMGLSKAAQFNGAVRRQ